MSNCDGINIEKILKNKNNISLHLNWPPSVNTYWRRNGSRYFISKKGTEFRKHVYSQRPEKHKTIINPLKIIIYAYPPDRRKRDIDNILKSLLDSLAKAGIYLDDNQVADLHIIRANIEKPGKVVVFIQEL